MKRLAIATPHGWVASASQGYPHPHIPTQKSVRLSHLYTWVRRGILRALRMTLAKARTWPARSGVKRTNHTPLPSHNLHYRLRLLLRQKSTIHPVDENVLNKTEPGLLRPTNKRANGAKGEN